MTFAQARKIIDEHNTKENITKQFCDKHPIKLYIVYTKDSFDKKYTEKQRTYETRSDNKYFLPNMCGNSLFGNCLDGNDDGVRLDWYFGSWKIERCYLMKDGELIDGKS